jgi:hypothetical protein
MTLHRHALLTFALVLIVILSLAPAVGAQIAVSGNDNKVVNVNGVVTVVRNPPPDTVTILVGNMIEKDYWVFRWDGSTLKDTGQRIKVNGGPVAIRTAEK